jgi:hypothetical protein
MRFLIWCFLIVAFEVAFNASGQSLTIAPMPQERIGNPTSKPEPRRLVTTDPVSLYRQLLSTSLEDRNSALRLLTGEEMDASNSVEARLNAVNLDSDNDLEYVLVITPHFPSHTIALVFDKIGGSWWVVGDFSYWWHWDVNEAERFIELREIVRYGRKEIIVRDWGGGTGVAETGLSIYRMQNGSLYRVFRISEDGFHFIYGVGTSEYEHRTLEYPDHDWNAPALLVTRHLKRIEPAQEGAPVRVSRDCSVFEWDAAAFVFVKNKAAMPNLCSDRAPGSLR